MFALYLGITLNKKRVYLYLLENFTILCTAVCVCLRPAAAGGLQAVGLPHFFGFALTAASAIKANGCCAAHGSSDGTVLSMES